MKRLKRWIQKLLLFLLKKLNMPKPFSDLTSKDMVLIHKAIVDFVEQTHGIIELYNMPNLVYDNPRIHFDKNEEYGTMVFTGAHGAIASINVGVDYEPAFVNLDDDTTRLLTKIIKSYLTKNGFI